MAKKVKDLITKEKAKINTVGILVILGVGVLAGVLFKSGEFSWGLVTLFGGGLAGMIMAWINKPEGGK